MIVEGSGGDEPVRSDARTPRVFTPRRRRCRVLRYTSAGRVRSSVNDLGASGSSAPREWRLRLGRW